MHTGTNFSPSLPAAEICLSVHISSIAVYHCCLTIYIYIYILLVHSCMMIIKGQFIVSVQLPTTTKFISSYNHELFTVKHACKIEPYIVMVQSLVTPCLCLCLLIFIYFVSSFGNLLIISRVQVFSVSPLCSWCYICVQCLVSCVLTYMFVYFLFTLTVPCHASVFCFPFVSSGLIRSSCVSLLPFPCFPLCVFIAGVCLCSSPDCLHVPLRYLCLSSSAFSLLFLYISCAEM